MKLIVVPTDKLTRNPVNPHSRIPDKEFIESVKAEGIKVPLIVQENGKDGNYIVIAGERRRLAAIEAKITEVPCILEEKVADNNPGLLLLDNIQRENMNLWEEHLVIAEMLKKMTISEVAKKIHKSTKYVIRRAGLGRLHPTLQQALLEKVPGLTDKVAFMLSQFSHSVQKEIIKNAWDTMRINDRETKRFRYDESDIKRMAEYYTQQRLLSGTLNEEDALAIYKDPEKIGKVNINEQVNSLFEEKEPGFDKTQYDREGFLAKTKEILKKFSTAVPLSTIFYADNKETLTNDQWRKATDNDDPKNVKQGVMINGKDMGKLISFVKVTPSKKSTGTSAYGNAVKKPLSEKEQEKARQERKEKIIANKAVRKANQILLLALKETSIDLGEWYLKEQFRENDKNTILRIILGEKAFNECDDREREFKKFIAGVPKKNLLSTLLLAPMIEYRNEQVAKLIDVTWKTILKNQTQNVVDEMKKAKEAKLTKKKK